MSEPYNLHSRLQTHKKRAKDARLVIIHPHTKNRGFLTALFIDEFGDNLHYYAAQEGQDKPADFVKGLLDQFSQAAEGFGDKTRAALRGSLDALAKALVADLGLLGKGTFALLLDELDRLTMSSEFVDFLQAVTNALPKGAQLILCTRRLPHTLWLPLITEQEAVIMNGADHPEIVSEEELPLLEVYALGAGNALVNGQPIMSWDGALPRNLFFFFVDRPLVTRDEVFATFWPDLSVKEATNVFHVTKRKISERLDHELTSYNSGFYVPSGQMRVYYDATDFLESIESAAALGDEEASKRYRHAVDIYRGDFLANLKMEWAAERRRALKSAYAQALIALGRLNKVKGEAEEALGYFLRALHETPEREDVHREVMMLYNELGRVEDAKAQYKLLEEELKKQFDIPPSRESRELFESLS
jgi:two-component SAPR family response regulator